MNQELEKLREAVEANLADHFDYIGRRHPRMRVVEMDGVRLVDSGFATDTFNTVFGPAQHERVRPKTVAAVVAYYAERSLPFSWWVGPSSDVGVLQPVFATAGLRYAEGETAMAISCRDFSQPEPDAPVEVRRVRTRAELAAFARIQAANWEPPDEEVIAWHESAAGLLLDEEGPVRQWVAYLDGEPVAAAELHVTGSIGGVYNVSTRAHARGRRIGSRMTWTALREARELGLEYAVLQASEEGRGVYERLGFRGCGAFGEFKAG